MKRYNITVNGQTYDVQVEETGAPAAAGAAVAAPVSRAAPAALPAAAAAAPAAASAGGQVVKAPMPGTLMSYKVAVGQAVRKGDVVLILEAMKMENEIVAPVDGAVTALLSSEGSSVNTGDPLFKIG